MKVGLLWTNRRAFAAPAGAAVLARAAEGAGVESLWTSEHVVIPSGYSTTYPYSETGRMPIPDDTQYPDSLVWLAFVAGVTSRIRLMTGMVVLPQRNPVLLAKEAATLDVLSGGRLGLGLSVGWFREEFQAMGAPFEERGARMDEAIAAMRALWSEDETFAGRYYGFSRARCYPKPVQRGGPPIVIGGHSMRAARRAGELGDGFFPLSPEPEPLFEECRRAAEAAGRSADIELSAEGKPDVESAKRLEQMGVSRIIVKPPTFELMKVDRAFGEFAEDFVSKIR